MPPQTSRMPVFRLRYRFVKCVRLSEAGWKLSTGLSRMQRESRFLTSHSLHLCHPCPEAQNRHVAMVAAILSGKNRAIMSLDSRWGGKKENFLGFIFVSSLVSEDWKTKSKQRGSRNCVLCRIYHLYVLLWSTCNIWNGKFLFKPSLHFLMHKTKQWAPVWDH